MKEPKIFAMWLENQGFRVEETASSFWYEASYRVYQAFPYHWLIEPTENELSRFLIQKKAIALRYSTPVESTAGCISYHVTYDEPHYSLENLDRRSRQNIRKGLRKFSVRKISFERLADEGWLLQKDTQERQGRKGDFDVESWRKRCLTAEQLPGFEAWGAIVGNRLAASLLTFQMGDCCEMLSQQCHSDFLRDRVNNALAYVVTETMIERPAIKSVFYTLQSLDAPESVDEFKFRMGYRAVPVRQRVVFHPWTESFVDRYGQGIVTKMRQKYAYNQLYSRAEGMLRFYRQGNMPLSKQEWPDCLSAYTELYLQDKSDHKYLNVHEGDLQLGG